MVDILPFCLILSKEKPWLSLYIWVCAFVCVMVSILFLCTHCSPVSAHMYSQELSGRSLPSVSLTNLEMKGYRREERMDGEKEEEKKGAGEEWGSVCSGVGYGKMDYPTQQAIYHCQREREGKREWGEKKREGGWGIQKKRIGWRAWGKIEDTRGIVREEPTKSYFTLCTIRDALTGPFLERMDTDQRKDFKVLCHSFSAQECV